MRRGQKQGMSFFMVGLLTLIVLSVLVYLGFTKAIPFKSHYEVGAVFRTANNVKPGSFVRIAGVNVGKVTEVERDEKDPQSALVRMRIDDKGLPIHKDATLQIRPRIFLEGNFFVDLQPGSPSAPTIDDGDVIPINQTKAPVQLDQILTSLQEPTREQLRGLLDELSTGLDKKGGAGFNGSIRYWESAYKNGAIVADAQQGEKPGDLSGYLKSAGKVAESLNASPIDLQNLITDFNVAANAFAREQGSLTEAIAELPRTLRAGLPALAALNDAFPSVRGFAKDFLPPTKSSGPALDAGLPLVRQLRALLSEQELGGLVDALRPTVPSLARLNRRTPALYEQVSLASNCQNEQILPWTKDTIDDAAFPAVGPVFVESTKPLGGLAGESRSGDANGQWFRVLLSGGVFAYPQAGGNILQSTAPLMGVNPPPPAELTRPYRPDVPCETQEDPDLSSTPVEVPNETRISVDDQAGYQKIIDRAKAEIERNTPDNLATGDKAIVDAALQGLGK